MKFKAVLFLAVFYAANIFAQYNEYYPEYDWYTIEGEHAVVHFHPGAERSAKVVLKIIEDVWGPITTLYQYEPDKINFVIKDIDDYSNGATYFFDNKIEIWASALDFDLRGTHNWLRNVISHEFTHMVQIQKSMKLGRGLPAFYLQVLSYEDEYRPDILYGYPNVLVSYPLATLNVPAWWAEGTAQYMRKEFNYDNWDTHRDMILRSYVLDGNMLTWNQMGVFGKTSLGNESVYNSGFALVRYIAEKYGEDKLREINNHLGDMFNFTIDAAFEDALGKDGTQIYNEWKDVLIKSYTERTKDLSGNLIIGDTLANVGFGNFYPTYSEDGKKLYYISNKTSDYFGLSSLYEYNIESKKEKLLIPEVRSTIALLPGKQKILFAKLSEDNPNWANIHDLYIYDIKEDEDTRITFGLRANNPSVSHYGNKVVFVFQKDGTSNLGIVDIDGKNFKQLTFYKNGEQVYNPKFNEDNSQVVFDYNYANNRSIATVDTSVKNGVEFLLKTDHDVRNPVIKNGKLYFASDETGIFNIYSMDLVTEEKQQLTNVLGGAFMPDVNDNGDIAYAGYTSAGYKIFSVKNEEKNETPKYKYVWLNNPPLNQNKPNGDLTAEAIEHYRNYNDYDIPDYEKKKYSGFFSKMTFFPFLRYDNYKTISEGIGKFKPGVYFTSSDMLNRFSLFGGGSINNRLERDLFLIFEYRDKLPLLYNLGLKPQINLELYSISRKTDVDIVFDSLDVANSSVNTSVTYSLFEFDIAVKHKIFAEGNNLELRFIWSSYDAILGSFVFPGTTTLYPTSSDTYFIGRNLQLRYTSSYQVPSRDSDINPIGRKIDIKYNYEWNKYNNDNQYEVADGILKPLYNNFNFSRVELNWFESFETWKDHTISSHLRFATIFGPPVPDFFDFYLGGLVGMRGYPFYAVSGNDLGWLNITYRFPLFKNLDTRIGSFYLDKIYFSAFADFGHAWTDVKPSFDQIKKGIGAELRIKLTSFYLFPTSVFFSAAYAFDKFNRDVRGDIVQYGQNVRYYGGILFDFNLYSEQNSNQRVYR